MFFTSLFDLIRGRRTYDAPVPQLPVTIRRIEMVWRRCANCHRELREGDVVVSRNDDRRAIRDEAHAHCAIFLRTPQGVKRLDGTSVDTGVRNGSIKSPPPIAIVVTPDEWAALEPRPQTHTNEAP